MAADLSNVHCIILADYLSKCKNLLNNSGKILDNYCNQVCVSELFVVFNTDLLHVRQF